MGKRVPATVVGALFTRDALAEVCARLPAEHRPNEARTEDQSISNNPPFAPTAGIAA